MKLKYTFFFICSFSLILLLTNSCTKNKQDYIQTLFTGGHWQLSSVQVTHYLGASTINTDTLYATCNLTQVFTFNTDNTCTFTNYSCEPQPTASGHWSLSADKLFLQSDIVCKDSTSSTGSSKPFQTARIVNLGQYSLILQTGDLQTYYLPTQARTVTQYGFVRQKTP